MEGPVKVSVTTETAEETLHFSGSGILHRDSRGIHLRYSAAGGAGEAVCAAVHLGAGRALVVTDSYRLLLCPGRTTRMSMTGGIDLTVTAHRAAWHLAEQTGEITLDYSLSAAGQEIQQMLVTMTLENR